MGAEQSSQRSSAPAEATLQKTCYYELLSVERTATDDELKKAYRRKALELHPDRNINDVANATRKFAEVQTAYEILSDPQERAWYDSHRDDILRGDSGATGGDEEGRGAGPRYYNNVRLTPAEDLYRLMGRFSTSVPFDDSPYGFFGILEATFAQLALEEEAAFSWDSTRNAQDLPFYHPFGSAGEDYDAVAKPFYKDWSNFATTKSFSWKDRHRLSDAPDRQVRRIMEKENKKAREQGIREFNDAVRSLVAFVRKRDPRYIPNMQSEAERQQVLRDSANAQAQRQRAANQERRRQQQEQAGYVEPGHRAGENVEDVSSSGEEEEEQMGEVVEEIECVVCDKTFKSEKQFEAHEKSRKHVKAVQTLKWQMRKENKAFNLDEHELLPPRESNEAGGKKAKKAKKVKKEEATEEEEEEDGDETKDKATDDDRSDSNDEYAPRHVVESRFKVADEEEEEEEEDSDNEFAARMKKLSLKKQKKKKKQMKQMGFFDEEEEEEQEEKEDEEDEEKEEKHEAKAVKEDKVEEDKVEDKKETDEKEDSEPTAKMGKAKARREKRAAIQAAAAAAAGENEGVVACTMCRKTFSSNTKLHQHLRADHTAAPKGKGKKKR